jgi:hypothetical protein
MAGANSATLTAGAILERKKIFKELDPNAADPVFEGKIVS